MGCITSKDDAKGRKAAAAAADAQNAAKWEEVRLRLPCGRTADERARRAALFQQFDKNGNKQLSFDEVLAGCRDVLHLDEFTTRLRDIVKRAFNKAVELREKDDAEAGDQPPPDHPPAAGHNEEGGETVDYLGFRRLLCYVYNYLELIDVFEEVDTSGNMLVDRAEFQKAVPRLERWGVTKKEAMEVFHAIDTDGSGNINFDEFAAWASNKKLEAEGDPDSEKL